MYERLGFVLHQQALPCYSQLHASYFVPIDIQ